MDPITNIYGSYGSYNEPYNEYLWLLQSITNFYEILLNFYVIELNQEFTYYLIKKLLS